MPDFIAQEAYRDNTPPRSGNSTFDKDYQESTIKSLGYNIVWWPSVAAPNNYEQQDNSLTDQNIRGIERIWPNAFDIEAIITSIDVTRATEIEGRKDLSEIQVTVNNEYKLGRLDRIMVKDSEIAYTENLRVTRDLDTDDYIAYTTYPVKFVYATFKYESDTQPYRLLTEGSDFTVENNLIRFSNEFTTLSEENFNVSIRYNGTPTYYVADVPHAARTSKIDNQRTIELPVMAIARLAHQILELENASKDKFLDNAFDLSCTFAKGKDQVSNEQKFIRTLKYTPTQTIFDNLTTTQRTEMEALFP